MNNKKMLDFQTIAVDFDGTLCYSKWPELGQPNQALIEYCLLYTSPSPRVMRRSRMPSSA